MIKLLCELNTGLHSVEKEGWLTEEEEVKNNIKNRIRRSIKSFIK